MKDDTLSIKEDSNKNISDKEESVSLGSLNISVQENSIKNDSISLKDTISIRESSNNLSYKEDYI